MPKNRLRLRTEALSNAAAEHGDRSAYAISKRTGLDQALISRWRRGLSTPSTQSLVVLSTTYGLNLTELVGPADGPENSEAAAEAPAAASSERTSQDRVAADQRERS
ncbi:helix-turn-helix transcriptional regulator [Streptomyces zaomyceticus]|uniref:helix-turn-helix transcriptional regulator n=1 Tax=Streptomyces zaomyceticus TaxID=68286 RepID=UPI002E0DCDCE|nr:helix-turn-helix domain-containing protein [Streptomyces zaomyceticus]